MINTAAKLFTQQEKYFNNFSELGLPNRKTERWKFTPVSALYQKDWEQPSEQTHQGPTEFNDSLNFNAQGKVTSKNNCEVSELSADEISQFFEAHEKSHSWEKSDALYQWHLSQLSAVYKITYKGSETLSITHSLESGHLNYALIIECVSDQATILENFTGDKGIGYHQTSRYIDVKSNQTIKHALVNQIGPEHSQQIWTYAQLKGKNSFYKGLQTHIGGGFCRSNPFINIQDTNSFAEFNAFYFLEQAEHFDFFSQIKHYSRETESNQVVKGLLHDEAKFAFTGNIYIEKDSQLVNAAQFNKNLVMSKKAQAFGQPQLEIYADDVKCAHGSTTGQFDVDELFYLNARGISATKAKRLMAQAYGLEIFALLENKEVYNYLEDKLKEKLKRTYGD